MDRPTFIDASHRIAEQIPDRHIELREMIRLNDYAVALSAVWRGTPVVDIDTLTAGGPIEVDGSELHSGESMVVEVQDGRVRSVRVYR
jgi:ketosteroid isomerase-like protein